MKKTINVLETNIKYWEGCKKIVMENHSNYIKNMNNAWDTLQNGTNLPENVIETLNNIIERCTDGALRTRREASDFDKRINDAKKELKLLK